MTPKEEMIAALLSMPDEAFSWFVLAARADTDGQGAQIWPSEIGGFSEESQTAIRNLRQGVTDWFKAAKNGAPRG